MDATVREERYCFVTSELEQNMKVGNKEHLIDLMELLLTENTDFAATWSRLYHKAELLVVPLALSYEIGCH